MVMIRRQRLPYPLPSRRPPDLRAAEAFHTGDQWSRRRLDLLDEWPQNNRDIVYEVMLDACRKAASGQLPAQAVADNFRRFLKKRGILADIKDAPSHLRPARDRSFSGV
nr:DUF982 domain-containing protein [Rhizobium leguminosarum]